MWPYSSPKPSKQELTTFITNQSTVLLEFSIMFLSDLERSETRMCLKISMYINIAVCAPPKSSCYSSDVSNK